MSADTAPRRCFTRDYELGRSPAVRDLERSVLGCDYGATSWTTRDEAGTVADLLGLRPSMRLLDVGAGAGSAFVSRSSARRATASARDAGRSSRMAPRCRSRMAHSTQSAIPTYSAACRPSSSYCMNVAALHA
jgi:hypothetical protein